MCAFDRMKIQDVITPYIPYILRALLREIVEEDKENNAWQHSLINVNIKHLPQAKYLQKNWQSD